MKKKAVLRSCLRFLGFFLLNVTSYPFAALVFLLRRYPILFNNGSQLKTINNLLQEAATLQNRNDIQSLVLANHNGQDEGRFYKEYKTNYDTASIYLRGTGNETEGTNIASAIDLSLPSIALPTTFATKETKDVLDSFQETHASDHEKIQTLIHSVEKSIEMIPTVTTIFLLILSMSFFCSVLARCCRITSSPYQGLLKGFLVTLFIALLLDMFLLILMILLRNDFVPSCDFSLGLIFGDSTLSNAIHNTCASDLVKKVAEIRRILVTQQQGLHYFRKMIIFSLSVFVPVQTAMFIFIMVILKYISSKNITEEITKVSASQLVLNGRELGEYPMLKYYWSGGYSTPAMLTVDV